MNKVLILLTFSFFLSPLVYSQSKHQELYKAITQNDVENVAKLLQDSADANYVVGSGAFKMTMLNAAINVSKNKNIVELLLKHKADVNSKDAFNTTALMYAASSGNREIVELLLSYRADVNANDGQGNSVLSAAKESKNKSIIKLIEKKLQDRN
jgi:ankyrin repeat protein